MKNKVVTRAFNAEMRTSIEKAGVITGRPVIYGSRINLGPFDEIIEYGAINERTDLRDVLFFVNHDLSKIPLARSRRNNGNSTMTLTPDEQGLSMESVLDIENNSNARALHSSVGRGDIDGMSFMFSIEKEEWENLESDHPTRRIKEIGRIIEVSAVNFPAYQETSISARDKTALDNAKEVLDNARRSAGVDTPDAEKRALALELAKARNRNLFV